MIAALEANGWTSAELEYAQIILIGIFLPTDTNVDGTILQNIVDSTGFTLKLCEGDTDIVNKKFSTIDETYTYLFSPEHAVAYAAIGIQSAVEALQTLLKSKGFTWSNDPIEGIGVQAIVDENSTIYFWNSKQLKYEKMISLIPEIDVIDCGDSTK